MKRIAIAGCGFIGRIHAASILRNPSLELCALIDRDAQQVRSMLEPRAGESGPDALDVARLRALPVFDSVEACLKARPVDIMDICVPTKAHYDAARISLEHGAHVLLEKPFTLEVENARRLMDLAKQKNRLLMVAHVVRFMPEYAHLARAVADKVHGELEFISLERRIGRPAWGDWRHTDEMKKTSGGALFDLQIHDIDFVQSILGSPATIECTPSPDERIAGDYMRAEWKYGSGARAVIQGGFLLHSATPFETRVLARFENATMELTSRAPGCVIVSDNKESITVRVPTDPDGFQQEISYFTECVAAGREPQRCTPESSLRAIELCHLHAKSIKEGVAVHV